MRIPGCAELLNLSGELLEGVAFGDSATLIALGFGSSKPHCAVYSWIVLDVEVRDNGARNTPGFDPDESKGTGGCATDGEPAVLPLVLVSHYVEFHSSGRFEKGDSIRSGYAIAYDGRGTFETEDTIYVLFGKGFRRPAALAALSSLPDGVINEYCPVIGSQSLPSGIAAFNNSSTTIYCDLQMSVAQGHQLLALVEGLRASGQHAGLESVFRDIEREIGTG